MIIKQISVFLENVSGRLAEVTKILAEGQVNLRAMTIADTADFGILRIIAANPDKAAEVLTQAGFMAKQTDVLAVEVEDRPGGLAHVLEIFSKNKVNIEYMYASLERSQDKAVIVIKVEDVQKGVKIVEENGLKPVNTF
ncbi:MAG: ACT domain-containing protein [Spirochaetaceae bacterium]|nr:ACT domain-containing protein [Spirochaetaceae bacterium]